MIQQCQKIKMQSVNLLPIDSNSKVQHLALINGWVAVSIGSTLIFIQLEDSSNFKIFQDIQIQRIINLELDILLIVKEFSVYLFHFSQKNVFLRFIYTINFLNLYTVCSYIDRSLILAGVDVKYNLIATNKPSKKRYFYFIKNLTSFFQKLKYENQFETIQKRLLYDQKMLILTLQNDSKSPISHISTFLQEKLIISCFENIILIHNLITAEKISEINLKNQIKKVIPIPHLFNLYNLIVRTQENQLIRIGADINGQKIGCELQKFDVQNVQDFVFIQQFDQDSKNQKNVHEQMMNLFILKNGQLFKYNYLKRKEIKIQDGIQNKEGYKQKISKIPSIVNKKIKQNTYIAFLKDEIIVKQIRYFKLNQID